MTASDHGILDTQQRVFTAIMKHKWAFGCCNVQGENE
jgi:hypothetical protein